MSVRDQLLKIFSTKSYSGLSLKPIGIDISDTAVRLTQVRQNRSEYQVFAQGEVNLAPGMVLHKDIIDMPGVLCHLTSLLENSPVQGDNVAIAMPDTQLIIHYLWFDDHLKGYSLEEAVYREMEEIFGFSSKEVYFDFCARSRGGGQEVLVVAIRKDLLAARIQALASLGLIVVRVDVASLAIHRGLKLLKQPLSQFAYLNLKDRDCYIFHEADKPAAQVWSLPAEGSVVEILIQEFSNIVLTGNSQNFPKSLLIGGQLTPETINLLQTDLGIKVLTEISALSQEIYYLLSFGLSACDGY